MILQSTIDSVRETARIEDVVGDFMTLRRDGTNFTALCPFHNEKTPSFKVSPAKNIYKCFGCGRSGDPVRFVMEHEKQSYPEAIRFLAKRYGIEIEETEQNEEQKALLQERDSLNLVNEFAQNVFVRNLHETQEGKSVGLTYFKERGYLEGTIKKFGLGYADRSFTSLKDEAKEQGISLERLQTLGLVTKNNNDFFRGRVTFPIRSVGGRIIGFGARVLRPGPKDPKYLNSSESPIYNKRKILYGMHFARNAIRRTDQCYLVEGYTDVITLHQAGIENVVASSGTSLTEDQVRAIQRFTSNVTVLYDGDKAGIKAAMRGLDIMLKLDMNVRLVLLPEGEDPDSSVKAMGSSEFLAYLEAQAKDFILFKTGLLTEESAHDPIAMTRVTRDIIDSIALIPDVVKRAHYVKECANQLSIDEHILTEQVNRAIQGNLRKERYNRPASEVKTDFDMIGSAKSKPAKGLEQKRAPIGDEYQERSVVRLLIEYGYIVIDQEEGSTVADFVLGSISDVMDTFDNELYRRFINWYVEQVNSGTYPLPNAIVAHLDEEIAKLAGDILMPDFTYSPNWKEKKQMPLTSQPPPEENYIQDSRDTVLRLKVRKIDKQILTNQKKIEEVKGSGDDEALYSLLKVHQRLKLLKNEIESQLNSIGIRLS